MFWAPTLNLHVRHQVTVTIFIWNTSVERKTVIGYRWIKQDDDGKAGSDDVSLP
jgi:hypothetical protein